MTRTALIIRASYKTAMNKLKCNLFDPCKLQVVSKFNPRGLIDLPSNEIASRYISLLSKKFQE